jgi:repressor LexA
MLSRTSTRQKALLYINTYIQVHGYSPSIREIQDEIQVGSTSVVAFHLDKLQNEGYITRQPGLSRTIRLTDKGDLYIDLYDTYVRGT